DADTFGFFRDFYSSARLARIKIDNRRAGVVFIRDEGEFSIFADRKLLGVRPDMPPIRQFARCRIYHTEAVSAFVRWRAIFIQPRCHSRRAAQCNEDSPSARGGVNASRPFAHWKGPDDAIGGSINHCDVA